MSGCFFTEYPQSICGTSLARGLACIDDREVIGKWQERSSGEALKSCILHHDHHAPNNFVAKVHSADKIRATEDLTLPAGAR
jgi:hypothetical protein